MHFVGTGVVVGGKLKIGHGRPTATEKYETPRSVQLAIQLSQSVIYNSFKKKASPITYVHLSIFPPFYCLTNGGSVHVFCPLFIAR